MSHTWILDKVGRALVNPPLLKLRLGRSASAEATVSEQLSVQARLHVFRASFLIAHASSYRESESDAATHRTLKALHAKCGVTLVAGVSAPRLQLSVGENCQEGDFDCESFVNAATQMVTQFLQRTDAF